MWSLKKLLKKKLRSLEHQSEVPFRIEFPTSYIFSPECVVNLSKRQFEQQWLMGFVYLQLESDNVCKKHSNRVLVKVQVSSFEDQLNRILWDEKIR